MKEGTKKRAVLEFAPNDRAMLNEPSIREKQLLKALKTLKTYSHKQVTQKDLMTQTHLTKREVATTVKNLKEKELIKKFARRYRHISIVDHAAVPPVERPVFLFSPQSKRLIQIEGAVKKTKVEVTNPVGADFMTARKLARK